MAADGTATLGPQPIRGKSLAPSWRRFPTEAFPPMCQRLIAEAASARGVDPAYVGVPMLAALAGAIGNSRGLRMKASYIEPAVLWAALVQRSGTIKSAGLDDVLRPHRARNRKLLEETGRAFATYEQDLALYRKNRSSPPPERPRHRAVLVDDVTVEALIMRLADNPRGLLLGVDELAGWVGSFDAYKHARGVDVNKFLTMHRAGELRSDRKSGDRPTIYVPRAALSIVGTIQPRTLARVMGTENLENGLLGRLLVTMPPTPCAHWTDADVARDTYREWESVVEALVDLDCDCGPGELGLSANAWPAWREFHDALADRGVAEDDLLAAALAKLRGGALRIALVLALARAAEERQADSLSEVDLRAMKAGIALASWFANEAERVYATLQETEDERVESRVIEFIARSGGRVTARDLARGPRSCRPPGAAEAILTSLVKAGRGSWENLPPGPNGGSPTREFILKDPPEFGNAGDTTTKLSAEFEVVSPSPLPGDLEDEIPPSEVTQDQAGAFVDGLLEGQS